LASVYRALDISPSCLSQTGVPSGAPDVGVLGLETRSAGAARATIADQPPSRARSNRLGPAQ